MQASPESAPYGVRRFALAVLSCVALVAILFLLVDGEAVAAHFSGSSSTLPRTTHEAVAAFAPPSVPPSPSLAPAALADGCIHVYLDVGTNVGIQFRKLFTPDKYPDALIRDEFLRYFGPGKREDVCAFGWEPNPHHALDLLRLQDGYRALGRRITINTEAAAGLFNGLGVFKSDNDKKNFEWGSKVEPVKQGEPPPSDAVVVVDIATWIESNVLRRRTPNATSASGLKPAVVMKLDIEGSDENVLAKMFQVGALCHIDMIYIEKWHVRHEVHNFLSVASDALGCKVRIEAIDDEKYYDEKWSEPTNRRRGLRLITEK
jgi:hypothetical protein